MPNWFKLAKLLRPPLALGLAFLVAGCPPPAPSRSSPTGGRVATTVTPPPPSPLALSPEPEPLPASPSWRPITGRLVVLDAGHGGNDRGASHFGVREKDVNLDLVKRLALRLENQGITVILTRRQDVFLPLPERSSIANQYPQAIFVSIHCNASTNNPAATGVETFVLSRQADNAARQVRAGKRYQVTGGDQALATLLARSRERAPALAQALQNTLATRLGVPNRGVKQADLAVLRETFFCPAILVEVGFISNATTANQMASAAWRGLAAEALAEGIVDYLRKS